MSYCHIVLTTLCGLNIWTLFPNYVRINLFFSFVAGYQFLTFLLSGLLEYLCDTLKSLKAQLFPLRICIQDMVFSIITHRQCHQMYVLKSLFQILYNCLNFGVVFSRQVHLLMLKTDQAILIQFVLFPMICTLNGPTMQISSEVIVDMLITIISHHFKYCSYVSLFTFMTMTDYPKIPPIFCLGPWTLIFSLCQKELKLYFEN